MSILKKIVEESLNELAKYDPDEIDGQRAGSFEEDMELLEDEEEEEIVE
jgi:hypothetical protein